MLPDLWRRFNVENCVVVPRLVGASHAFNIGGTSVVLRLPSLPTQSERAEGDPVPFKSKHVFRTSKISCHHLRSGRPFCYDVHQVDVYVRLKRRISIPTAALGRIHSDDFSSKRRAQLDRMMTPSASIAAEALDRWLRTVRWKTAFGSIGQRQIVGNASGWSDYLFDSATKQKFYASGHFITVHGDRPITKREWNSVGRALSSGTIPPVWFDFLFDGEHRIASDDLPGGILCLAIACESLVRELMTTHLRRPVNDRFSRIVSVTPISRFLEKWPQLGLWSARWQNATDLTKLKRLFELRNDVAHGVRAQTLRKSECREVASAVRNFVIQGSPTAEKVLT